MPADRMNVFERLNALSKSKNEPAQEELRKKSKSTNESKPVWQYPSAFPKKPPLEPLGGRSPKPKQRNITHEPTVEPVLETLPTPASEISFTSQHGEPLPYIDEHVQLARQELADGPTSASKPETTPALQVEETQRRTPTPPQPTFFPPPKPDPAVTSKLTTVTKPSIAQTTREKSSGCFC